jgi:predicted nucleotidyltransferase
MAAIRRFAREVARRFEPKKIFLFGSRAYGKPHADSDVDILVVMPARNQLDQAVKIERTCDPPFPLDLLVRTPANFRKHLADGDSLLCEIVAKGKILYEEDNKRQTASAQRTAAMVEETCRKILGLRPRKRKPPK